MKFETADISKENVRKIAETFPGVVTEGKVNFELLRAMLGDDVYGDEAYEFTWVGKREAISEAAKPIRKALRPKLNQSKEWNNTGNIYIEGDNLETLKLIQESYYSKIKLIYIDPPYNTGSDFVYKDNFEIGKKEYDDSIGVYDEEGDKLFKNNESNGRFHSDWCSMMYPRLLIAQTLLTDDGVIFISIDDNEVAQLRKICDEIFGEYNFISQICHKSRASISNDKIISPNHNIILLYAKDLNTVLLNRRNIGLDPDLTGFDLDDNDGRGSYRLVPVDGPGGAKKGNPFYSFLGVEGYWRFSKDTMSVKFNDGLVVKKGNGLYQKYYLTTAENTRRTDNTWWDDGGLTSTATAKLKRLMGTATFDTPKPVELIIRMLKLFTHFDKDSIILDFFSGSSTTAQAVMQLNSEDNGNRKFIMVQLPESTPEKSEAYKNGYKNICEIGEERIRRAGDMIKSQTNNINLDIGFRTFYIDSSNMNDVYFNTNEITQDLLQTLESNIKSDRTDSDVLFACLLDWGLSLSLPYTDELISGNQVFTYNNGDLIACLEKDIKVDVVEIIAKRKPLRVVFRDNSFLNSSDKVNMAEIFKLFSPNTSIKVI